MAISETHAGRRYPPTDLYEVSAAKIAEFARALGDDAPAPADPPVVAPPTFVAVVSSPAWSQMFDDPELGLALNRIVHAEQKFSYDRLLRAGDVITAELVIDKVRLRGATEIITTSVAVTTSAGEPICTAQSTFYHSREVSA